MSNVPASNMSTQYSPYNMGDQHQGDAQANAGIQQVNLPPIRAGDAGGANGHAQPPAPPQAAPGMPTPVHYWGHGQMYPVMADDPNAPMRYPIPPADSRMMSGGRHKKEIKRRTKTGCLTCRKRRIKCDEHHPACRNCQKSKRDCLGYDPIFKPQPGPTSIQPANTGTLPATSDSTYQALYASQYQQTPSAAVNTSVGPERSTAIDPSLSVIMAQPDQAKQSKIDYLCAIKGHPPQPVPADLMIANEDRKAALNLYKDVYASAADRFLETDWFVARGEVHLAANDNLIRLLKFMSDKFHTQPYQPNFQNILNTTYSLEAQWIWAMFNMCRGSESNTSPSTAANENSKDLTSGQPANEPQQGTGKKFTEEDVRAGVHKAAKRIDLLETLLLNEHLPADSPLTQPSESEVSSSKGGLREQLRGRELSFWRFFNVFLTLKDDEASSAREIDETLAACRQLLESRENRDVLYSIMVCRHLGARTAEQNPDGLGVPTSNSEDDDKNKYRVAKGFLEKESDGHGTTQVSQRICGMAVRSWERRG